jgi:biotin carboxyl carrier protein
MEYHRFKGSKMSFKNENNSLVIDDTPYSTGLNTKFLKRKKYEPRNPKFMLSYIPGTIRDIFVNVGEQVKMGDKLLVFEAMKMKNLFKSSVNAKIKAINVQTGQMVAKNTVMIEFE